jgi:hypothetical protein
MLKRMLVAVIVVVTSLVVDVGARVLIASNELLQLQNYIKSSPVNETALLYLLDKCARGESIYPTSYYCGHQAAIHKLEEPSMVNMTRDLGCTYHMSEIFGIQEERFSRCFGVIAGFDYYYMNISQRSCNANPPVKGGASFDITCKRGGGIGMGYVIDHLDHTYTIQCRVPRLVKEVGGCNPPSSTVSAMNCTPGIDIKLDYEYFHAYHDAGFLPKQHSIYYIPSKCNPALSTPTNALRAPPAVDSRQSNPAVVQTTSNMTTVITPNPPVAGWVQYSNFTDSMWTSVNASRPGFLSRRLLLDIIRKYDIDMIGESHMRYTWDLLIQMYAQEDHLSHLGRKHANSEAMGIQFRDVSYFWMVARALQKLPCLANETSASAPGRKHIYVLQSGTWDLGFAPGRYAVHGALGARSMLDAVAARLRRKDCVQDTRFIIVGTTLYPNCDHLGSDNGKCVRSRHFRSNPTIRAVDQWMLWYTRTQLGLSEKLVKFVDTSEIISPRLYTKERLCVTHFLCHKNGPIVETTPPGRAVLAEVLRAIRETVEEDGWSEESVPVNGTGTTAAAAVVPGASSPSIGRYRNIGDFDGKIAKVANGTDWRYFLVEDGCRREMDAFTARIFSSSIEIVTVQDTADILMVYDTPLLAEPYISWADKTLYRIDASREIFAMGDSKRHSVKNMGVAMVRGLDLEKVRLIQDVDMNRIPVGDAYVN